MSNFLEIFLKYNNNSFLYKKHLSGVVSQGYESRMRIFLKRKGGKGGGGESMFLMIATEV